MAWEENENTIRSGHGNSKDYSTCRTTTFDDKLPRGIKAVYCQRKDGKGWETKSYLFPKSEGWDKKEAKQWFKTHNKTVNKRVVDYLVRDLVKNGDIPAIIVKSPIGKMINGGIVKIIVKTREYKKNIGVPVAVAEEDGKIYSIVRFNSPVKISKDQFEALIDRHNITEDVMVELKKQNKEWDNNVLFGYPFKILKEFKIPIDFYIPPDTMDWVEEVNIIKVKVEDISTANLEKASDNNLLDVHDKMHDLWNLLKRIDVTEKRINTASLIVNKHALVRNMLDHRDVIHKKIDSLDEISVNKSEDTERKDREFNRYVPICKIDEEKKIVYGEVLVPDTYDAQGHKITEAEIEKACHWYMINSQKNKVMHKGHYIKSDVVECYIVPQDLNFKNPQGEEVVVKKGTWFMGTKIYDEETWKEVKDGKLTGYSIGGIGFLEEVETAKG